MAKYGFAVISDPHYFSPSLTDGKCAYALRSGSDQKCLLESGAIIDAAFRKITEDKEIDAVFIPGDLTNDGEICSHEEFCEKLNELSKYKKVFVTTATHDFCCDNNAGAYFGENVIPMKDTADISYLRNKYKQFGFEGAISVYENFNGLCSYVTKLCDGIRLFGLNDDQNGEGGSGFNDEHLKWIIKQLKDAKSAGDIVIAMQHHVVLPHFTELLTKGGVCCQNNRHVAEEFAANGVDILFVGHSHWQNITEYKAKNGNIMTQVNVASLSGHPAPIFKVTISDDEVEMHTEYVTEFEYNGKIYDAEYITNHTKELISNVLTPASEGNYNEFSERLKALGVQSKVIKNLFPLIKHLANFICSANAGSLGKMINTITFGKGVRKDKIDEIKNIHVLDIIYNIYLNLFDGGLQRYKNGSAVYSVVCDLASLPEKITKRIPFVPKKIRELCAEIRELICLLMNDSTENNHKKIIIKRS